jgi:transposase
MDRQQVFDEPALNRVVATYRGGLTAREAELAAVDAELAAWAAAPPLAATVAKLGAYRGISQVTAMTLATEVVDWRRFATARAFMGFSGLIPSEYSSGARSRRGQITKAGPVGVRTALIEAAWPTGTGRASGSPCPAAKPAPAPRPWPGPGRPSSGCVPSTKR